MILQPGQRVRIPQHPHLGGYVRIEAAFPAGDGWQLFVEQASGVYAKVELTASQAAACDVLTEDGAGDSKALLAGLWTAWMHAAGFGARSAALAASSLKPYAHQMNAVYGAEQNCGAVPHDDDLDAIVRAWIDRVVDRTRSGKEWLETLGIRSRTRRPVGVWHHGEPHTTPVPDAPI